MSDVYSIEDSALPDQNQIPVENNSDELPEPILENEQDTLKRSGITIAKVVSDYQIDQDILSKASKNKTAGAFVQVGATGSSLISDGAKTIQSTLDRFVHQLLLLLPSASLFSFLLE